MYLIVLLLSFLSFAPVAANADKVEFKNYPNDVSSYTFNSYNLPRNKRTKNEFHGEALELVIDHGFNEDSEHKSITKKIIRDDDGKFYTVTEDSIVHSSLNRKNILVDTTADEAQGTQRTLIVPVGDPVVSGSSLIYTQDSLKSLYFSETNVSLNTYYNEVSSNRVAFTGGVTNILGLNGLCEGGDIFENDAATALMLLVDDEIDLSNFDRVSFVFPEDDNCLGGALGVAIIRNFEYVNKFNNPVKVSFNWNVSAGAGNNNPNYFLKVIAHEFGHNFGLKHDNGNSCGKEIFESAECESFEYGGVHSIMGFSPNLAHVNAIQKNDLEWFTQDEIAIINSNSFSGEFTISPIASADASSLKAVKIRRDDGSYLVVEYHRPIGMEAQYFENSTLNYDGVQIYLNNDSFFRDSILLRRDFAVEDVNNGFQVFDLRDEASFGTSDELYDPISDINITTLAFDDNSASFRIEKNIQEGGGTTSSTDPYLHTNFGTLSLNTSGVTKADIGIVFNGDVLTSDTLLVVKIPKTYKKLIKVTKKNRKALFENNVATFKAKLAPLKAFTKKLDVNEEGQFVVPIVAKVIDKATKEVITEQVVPVTFDSGE